MITASGRGLEPSGFHGGSTLPNNDNNNNNHQRRRPLTSRSSFSWKRSSLVFATVAALCLIQVWMSYNYLTAIFAATRVQHENHVINSINEDTIEYFMNLTKPRAQLTLVHYDPFFLGGYRNQHMRFVSFVNFAVQHSIQQILLPSLRWGVSQGQGINGRRASAPHEYLFDVVYWNKHAEEWGLPRLVRYDPNVLEGIRSRLRNDNSTATTIPCFNTTSNLYSGLNEQLLRSQNTNPRKVNTWEEIGRLEFYSHCKRLPPTSSAKHPINDDKYDDNDVVGDRFTYLIPHGGSKGVGRLWADYYTMQGGRGISKEITTADNRTVLMHPEHHPVEKAINTILRPSKAIRTAIKLSIQSSTSIMSRTSGGTVVNTNDIKKSQKFVALHPRIERDMLHHRCSRFMEQNLTKVFDHLRKLPRFDLLFIAVNTELVMISPEALVSEDIAVENANVLNRTRFYGLFGNESHVGIPTFESGSRTAEAILFPEEQSVSTLFQGALIPRLVTSESLGITSLVASIVNFFTVIEAESFVGVKGSTFSTDLFSARYYMGKGGNFILSPKGLDPLIGPAPPHSC